MYGQIALSHIASQPSVGNLQNEEQRRVLYSLRSFLFLDRYRLINLEQIARQIDLMLQPFLTHTMLRCAGSGGADHWPINEYIHCGTDIDRSIYRFSRWVDRQISYYKLPLHGLTLPFSRISCRTAQGVVVLLTGQSKIVSIMVQIQINQSRQMDIQISYHIPSQPWVKGLTLTLTLSEPCVGDTVRVNPSPNLNPQLRIHFSHISCRAAQGVVVLLTGQSTILSIMEQIQINQSRQMDRSIYFIVETNPG